MNDTKFGLQQIAILALAVATAAIHLSLAGPETIMFYFNGLGYLGLAAALVLPQFKKWRSLIRWVLMAYTAVTILGWVVIGERIAIGYVDKVIELALIALLWLEGRKA